MPKETYLPKLFVLFRQYGYDGTTLAKIAAVTGLGKASLYHHFPGGKEEMMQAVLDYAAEWLQANVLTMLIGAGSPQERLQQMCDRVNELYTGGTSPCLLAILQSGTGRDLFHAQVKAALAAWIGAIATVLQEAGLDEQQAQERGEAALIAIQGALVLSQGLERPELFDRVIQQLPQDLCREVSR